MKKKKYVDFEELLQSIEQLDLSKLDWIIEDISLQYQAYLKNLHELPLEERKQFLNIAWFDEMIANQAMEGETKKGTYLQFMENERKGKKMMSKYTNITLHAGRLQIRDFQRLHSMLLKGTSLEKNKNYSLRSDDQKWVGYMGENGYPKIQYIPPRSNKIKDCLEKILVYMNNKENVGTKENPSRLYQTFEQEPSKFAYPIFIKPTITHVLLSILQPFDDGNTRLARLMQDVQIYQETNRLFNIKPITKLPYISLSQQYYQRGVAYRDNIAKIAQNPSNDTWKQFIYMNLGCIEDELNSLQKSLSYRNKSSN